MSYQYLKIKTEMESNEENNQSANDFVYDTPKLLRLLESISIVTESKVLQSIINTYLKELLDTPYVLIVPLLPSSEEGLIQVVNDRVLEKEIRFSVSFHLAFIDLYQVKAKKKRSGLSRS